jgi:hypothetical protein
MTEASGAIKRANSTASVGMVAAGDAKRRAPCLEDKDVEKVDVAEPRHIAASRLRPGADRYGRAYLSRGR